MNYTKGEWEARSHTIQPNHWFVDAGECPDERITISDWLTEANANLISASPDLYEALKRLLKKMPDCGGCIKTEAAMIEAQDALAKAEGKPS